MCAPCWRLRRRGEGKKPTTQKACRGYQLLRDATASTVNLAEVQTKLVREGGDPDEAWELSLAPISAIEPFTSEQAKTAGALVTQTRPLGLSLGDRACLALAITLGAPVYTADKNWKSLKLGIPIHVLR
jgi:ribonuclease VapC